MLGLLELLYGSIVFFFILYYYYKIKLNFWKKRGVVGPEPIFFFGTLPKDVVLRRKNLIEYFRNIYNTYKNVPLVGLFIQTEPVLMINDPELIKDVLITDSAAFTTRGFHRSATAEPADNHIFYVKTDKAQPVRTKVTPIFTPSKLRNMVPLLLQRSKIFKDWLDTLLSQNKQINYSNVAEQYTADLCATCLFGYDIQAFEGNGIKFLEYIRQKNYAHNWKTIIKDTLPSIVLNNKLYDLIGYYLFNNAKDMQCFTEFATNIDTYRKKNDIVRHDITDVLLGVKENGKLTEKADVIDRSTAANMYAFFFAGFETSSVTITNTMYELALNQSIQNKLREEIKNVRETNNRKNPEELTYDDINTMTYLDAVFKESLRKYPVADLLRRRSTSTYTFRNSEITIPENVLIGIPVCGIHFDPEIYPSPEVYDPERFIGDAVKSRHSMHYFPFGYGARNCVGERYGILQTKVAFITIVENYKIDACENTKMETDKEPVVQRTRSMYLKLTKIN